MPKFSAYMKGADGSMGPPGASIIDGVLANENMLPVPNQNKHAFLVGTTTPKHLWVWNENNPNENKWEDQGTTASMLEEVSASVTTIPWTTTVVPSITTQFSTSNQLDYINFDFTIPEGQPAGFGEVSITTQRLSYTTHPTASISTDGDNWSKNFHFDLGIPEGTPGGFSTYQPTSVSTLEWDAPATVEVINIITTPNDSKSFNFKFGVPQGRAAGFSTLSADIESIGWTEDPTVSISESGPNWGKNIEFDFKVPKTRPAGFGTSSDATAVTTAWDTQPQISVSTDGEDWEKNFHFGFEIPVGRPAGFGDINVTTSTLEANSNPWVKVNSVTDSPEYEKDFNFEFGLPKGIAAGFSTGQYVSVSTLDTGEQAVVEITTITTSPETAKEFNFHFGLPRGDALAIYDGITFTSTEDGIDYHWKYEQGITTLVFNRGTVSKLPIYIYNDNNRSIASTFKISTSTIEYNADEPFDGTMYLMMPATLQEVEVGTVSSTTYGYEPVISRSTGSTSTKVILDFIIPEGKTGEADTIFKTASGNIISFTDGIEAPIADLKVNIEPVQDLHGYDAPWPAGGGKNLFNQVDATIIGNTMSNNNGTFTNILTDTRTNLQLQYLAYNGDTIIHTTTVGTISAKGRYSETLNISNEVTKIRIKHNGISRDLGFEYPWTTQGAVTISIYVDGFDPTTVGGIVLKDIQFELGSSATSYAPYSNICPISGWTGMNVQRTGKNLFDSSTLLSGAYSDADFNIPSSSSAIYRSIKIFLKAGTYTLSTSVNVDVVRTLIDGGFSSSTYGNLTSRTFTTNTDGYVGLTVRRYDRGDWDVSTTIQIESGSTATPYEPYQGTTYPISWQSEAGTVYDGTLDVTTGVLTVDRASVDLGTLTWMYYNSLFIATDIPNMAVPATPDDRRIGIISSIYPVSVATALNDTMTDKSMLRANGYLYIYDSTYSDITTFKTAMSGAQLVYELATPLTYQLTPTEVTTILGVNNLWADTGDSNLTYFKNSDDGTSAGITLSNINSNIDKKSNIGHIHDDRYYTESEINTFLANKVDNIDLNKILASMGLIYYNDKLYVNPDQGV